MSDFLENRLKKLKIKRFLPKNTTIANYKPFVISNNFVFISGQLPLTKEGINSPGKIKNKINLNEYKKIMQITTANLLWNLNDCVKNINKDILRIKCCSIKGYFNSEDGFFNHSDLLNFTSDSIVEVLGDDGKHSRVAIGVSSLPKNSPVEIEGIFAIYY